MKSRVSPYLLDLYAALGLAVLTCVFYWKVLFGHSIFVFVDASRFFYPLWKWGGEVLHQGWIPLWNPDAQFGTPFFADPQMAYAYPPVPLLYAFLDPTAAFAVLIIFHHFWALLGFWLFARTEGFSFWTASWGSLVFGFSLHLVCSSWTPPALMAISWVPWVFLGLLKLYKGQKGAFLYLSLAWACQAASGYPVLVYLTLLAVILHWTWKVFWPAGERLKISLGFVVMAAGSGLLAIAYNLVWGLPFAELFKLSNYQGGAGHFQETGLEDLATSLNAFAQGHPLENNYHGPHYWVSTFFMGLPPVILILWGAMRGAYRKTSWGIGFLILGLSTGLTGWGCYLRCYLPGYSLVIHSGYWISLLALWAAWMAMESLELFLSSRTGKLLPWIWWSLTLSVFAASYLLGAPLFPVAFWVCLALTALCPLAAGPSARLGLLSVALGLSLITAAWSLNVLLDRSYYDQSPKVLAGLNHPGRLFFTPPLLKQAIRLEGPTWEDAYDTAKQNLYPNWPLACGKEEAPVYNTLQLRDTHDWTFQAFQYSLRHSRRVLDYLNVRYLFGRNSFADLKKLADSDKTTGIFENPAPLPKWFSVKNAMPAGPTLDGDFKIAAHDFLDYGKECFIADRTRAGDYQPRQVVFHSKNPNHQVILAPGKGMAFLVSSETNYPGWKVSLDPGAGNIVKKAGTVDTVNHCFRGVVLRDGESEAVFSFEPLTFRLGIFISLLACGIWAGLAFKRITG